MNTIRFILICAAALQLAAPAELAQAAWNPQDNVEIIASAAPGGGNDATAQLIVRLFQKERLVGVGSGVVNKPDGATAMSYLNRHPGNGHYLAITTPALVTSRITGSSPLAYTDITPVTTLFSEYILVAVHADSPLKTGNDLAPLHGRMARRTRKAVVGRHLSQQQRNPQIPGGAVRRHAERADCPQAGAIAAGLVACARFIQRAGFASSLARHP